MCNVCGARILLEGEILKTKSKITNSEYGIRATGEGPTNMPAKYSLRRNGGDWTKEFLSHDLADIVSMGGFDVKDNIGVKSKTAFLEKHFD